MVPTCWILTFPLPRPWCWFWFRRITSPLQLCIVTKWIWLKSIGRQVLNGNTRYCLSFEDCYAQSDSEWKKRKLETKWQYCFWTVLKLHIFSPVFSLKSYIEFVGAEALVRLAFHPEKGLDTSKASWVYSLFETIFVIKLTPLCLNNWSVNSSVFVGFYLWLAPPSHHFQHFNTRFHGKFSNMSENMNAVWSLCSSACFWHNTPAFAFTYAQWFQHDLIDTPLEPAGLARICWKSYLWMSLKMDKNFQRQTLSLPGRKW